MLPDARVLLRGMYQRGIVGLLLVSIALVTFLGLVRLNRGGFLTDWWCRLLLQGFGWGSYVLVAATAGIGGLLLVGKEQSFKRIPWHVVGGAEIMFVALLGVSHLFFALAAPWDAARAGKVGGYVGAVFSTMLVDLLGPLPAGIVLGVVFGWGAITASGLSLEAWSDRIEAGAGHAWVRSREVVGKLVPWTRSIVEPGEEQAADEPPTKVAPTTENPPAPLVGTMSAAPARPVRRARIALPPLDLLEVPAEQKLDEADNLRKAAIIEETLEQFGVPAKVIETNPGPVVTQFGVEPGYVTRRGYDGEETERKIRVAKIASLNKDLELALAAAPIRIEAPVPGRSIVGIEVPNGQISVVSLRRIADSTRFRRGKSRLKIALGEGTAGTPIVADLTKMPHLLIAGATGSGKSICVHSIAVALLLQNAPLTLRLVMIDPKRVELARYRGLPHLYGQVESDAKRVVGVLHWLTQEMQARYKKLAQVGARHLDEYNHHWRVGSQEYMARIVVLIDELADLILFAPDQVERSICRLAQMARAVGIHLVMATQRPSVDVVTGLIKANFPARIGFAVSSGMDSRVILDAVGAETLLSKGDMLYMSPDSSKLVRVQGSFVSEDEMARVVHYWRQWAAQVGWGRQPAPWEAILDQSEEPDRDDLLNQAIELVRQQGQASASMLQRRMRIGYPRASRLIDEMEALGVVGPAQRGGRPREVLDRGQESG